MLKHKVHLPYTRCSFVRNIMCFAEAKHHFSKHASRVGETLLYTCHFKPNNIVGGGRFGNYHLVQAKRRLLSMRNNCCFSKTDALHAQQRVAPKSETSGLIKCTFGNIETIGKTNNTTTKSWEQAWTKLYHALETSSDPCPLWAT